ncbi:hypothetical protein [Enterococcus faecalis]|uniref:hypothetical protein n=1 Tax=Enterococcus faecalis TaxID=1351 RepID=UPI00245651DF|nr:hypothetical protein [Enterococcus faecalis]MDH5039556.1 hypothetical protein [Enterococcus faecalis]
MTEEAVRLILDVDRNSMKDVYRLLKKKYDSQSVTTHFADNELLDKSLNDSDFLNDVLHKEYKRHNVDFFQRELPDGKTEVLFHAKESDKFLSVTEKVMSDMKTNPQKYLKQETPKGWTKELPLKEEIKLAKQQQAQMIADLNKPKKNKRYNKNTSSNSGLINDDVEL